MKKTLRFLLACLLALFLSACAGMADYPLTGASNPPFDCNGDRPSPFPPYCRPVH